MPPAAVAVATLAVTAASAGYSAYSAQQARKDAPKAPIIPDTPDRPKVDSYAADVAKSQALAASAGGTILSDPTKNRGVIGSDPNAPRKSLLGA